MKMMIRLLSLVALAAAFALPAFAQDTSATPAAQSICTEDARAKMYTDYYNLRKQTDAAAQKQARDIAGQYIQKYGSCDDQYSKAVQKFIDAYDKAAGDIALQNKLSTAYTQHNYPDAVAAAKDILTKNPDDVKTAITGAWAAYQGVVAKNSALSADAINLAQKALQLLDSGKTADNYFFSNNKDEARGWMEYVLGAVNVKTNNAPEATKHLIAVAQSNTPAKQEPTTYYLLAKAYEDEYQKQLDRYKTFTTETDESKVLLANINLTIDRIIDAYARAVAYSTKPEQQKDKTSYMATLTELYKSRHDGSDAGLKDMLASVTTTPLLITTPVTTPPATPATGTTTSGDGASGTKPPTTTPATTAPTTTPTTTKPTQQPPVKKPPVAKRHHG
ncbi:MAG: hypothetical protein DMF64_17120 [Acidobacteria bacterium]|nr:MAG: hypothetical protein DMF64_17120 [Acidobacteriota bacterium]